MLTFPTGRHADCQKSNRRQFLQVGALGAFGLSLSGFLRTQALAGPTSRETNCILLWMQGGPSHHETFDPKPEANDNVRGEFKPIATALPGVFFSEHVPRIAASAKHFTLLRSLNPRNGAHGTAESYMLSGHPYTPAMAYPCYGSVIAQQKGDRDGMPPFVQLGPNVNTNFRGGTAGFLSNALNPFLVPGDPGADKFSVRDLSPPPGVTRPQIERRLAMLQDLDLWQRRMEKTDLVASTDTFYHKAPSLLTSPRTKEAFNLSQETPKTRDGYGRTTLGQSCLLARRLIEAGSRFVTVSDGGWDTHSNNFSDLKNKKLPPLDQALPFLIQDLTDRGLLESTLVVWMGDFGRTPQINVNAGRDHWSSVGNVIFAGGGTRPGTVIGATDREGGYCTQNEYFTEDVAATIYQKLGVPLDTMLATSDGRPIHFWVGKPISEV